MKPGDFSASIRGRRECCDDTADMGKINRSLQRLLLRGDDRESFNIDLAQVLRQAMILHCSKDGCSTRHIEALFSIMRMLGLILVSGQQVC